MCHLHNSFKVKKAQLGSSVKKLKMLSFGDPFSISSNIIINIYFSCVLDLTLSQTTNFRLFHTERDCR